MEKSSELSCDRIITSLAETKLKISKNLESLEAQLLSEYKKVSDLQKSIEASKKELEELHDITYQAETLAALGFDSKKKPIRKTSSRYCC